MSISPKSLTQTNSGYGYKQKQHSWQDATLALLSQVKGYYENGGYDRVIQKGKEFFNVRITKLSDLEKMHEAELMYLYLMGKSYRALGQIDNAIGCFHIAYSQQRFEKQMLTSPYRFADFVEEAGQELKDIAGERGEDYVNNFQIEPFFDRVLAKSGCFIATAAYGSALAPEVLAFQRFRDESLLASKLGTLFVEFYYVVSPPLASFISRADILKRAARQLVLTPLLRVLKFRHKG